MKARWGAKPAEPVTCPRSLTADGNNVSPAKLGSDVSSPPKLLPPLVRFFARYGQHERSLFGFLLSSEPFGLQAFAERKAGAQTWYGLAEFYDYVRSVFGHRLSGAASYQTHWLRVAATVDTAQDLSSLEFRVLKTVAILNLWSPTICSPPTAPYWPAFRPPFAGIAKPP